ncbi:hypothetical protein [Priestia megaterium]|uniref:Uncharacterized protein n=1 Tax=Priestia megaterium TaxID=1404 RepID=A0A6M6DZI0_PRIMG|nr:hypothetical protein [Priestia megaterium]QJX80291.1 hypothetical protein FDZ14_29805 [Priestia megaterium]
MNSFKKLNLSFEIKSMEANFYIPFLAIFIGILYTCFSPNVDIIQYTSRILEFIVCPVAAWWSMELFLDYYEDKTAETLFSYPLSTLYHGIMRVTAFFIMYLAAFLILLLIITLKYPYVSFFNLVVLYVPQAVLYCYLGFFLMVLSRNITVPILILLAYVAMKYWTMGDRLFPLYNVMSFSVDMQLYPRIILLAIKNIALAFVLATMGHFILSRRKV